MSDLLGMIANLLPSIVGNDSETKETKNNKKTGATSDPISFSFNDKNAAKNITNNNAISFSFGNEAVQSDLSSLTFDMPEGSAYSTKSSISDLKTVFENVMSKTDNNKSASEIGVQSNSQVAPNNLADVAATDKMKKPQSLDDVGANLSELQGMLNGIETPEADLKTMANKYSSNGKIDPFKAMEAAQSGEITSSQLNELSREYPLEFTAAKFGKTPEEMTKGVNDSMKKYNGDSNAFLKDLKEMDPNSQQYQELIAVHGKEIDAVLKQAVGEVQN